MNFQNVVALVNRLLDKVYPGISLGDVSEATFESTLSSMLDMHDQLESLPSSDSGPSSEYNDYPIRMSLASSRKRRGPSSSAKRLAGFVKSLTGAGVPLQKAFDQACRLGVGGVNDAQ
jgi:hypothetical protein